MAFTAQEMCRETPSIQREKQKHPFPVIFWLPFPNPTVPTHVPFPRPLLRHQPWVACPPPWLDFSSVESLPLLCRPSSPPQLLPAGCFLLGSYREVPSEPRLQHNSATRFPDHVLGRWSCPQKPVLPGQAVFVTPKPARGTQRSCHLLSIRDHCFTAVLYGALALRSLEKSQIDP